MKSFLVNPVTLWLRSLGKKLYLENIYRKNHLLLEYMVDVKNCKFGQYNTIYKNTRLEEVELGDFTYVSKNCQIKRATIGKFCSIGPNVIIGLGMHPSSEFVSTHPIFYSSLGQSQLTFYNESIFTEYAHVEIGNDVWIGANVLIQDGIKIGDGAIIAAGAVVTKDVPPYLIVGGVPAKPIRERFTREETEFLLKFKWWNKGKEWIENNKSLFIHIKELFQLYNKP